MPRFMPKKQEITSNFDPLAWKKSIKNLKNIEVFNLQEGPEIILSARHTGTTNNFET